MATIPHLPDEALPADRTVPLHVVPGASIDLLRKHSLAVRWMHWINFPLLFTMIYSGLLIYWADSIPTSGHLSAVYRVGFGDWTLFRLFRRAGVRLLGCSTRCRRGWRITSSSCGCSR